MFIISDNLHSYVVKSKLDGISNYDLMTFEFGSLSVEMMIFKAW